MTPSAWLVTGAARLRERSVPRSGLSEAQVRAVEFVATDFPRFVGRRNKGTLDRELVSQRRFFDTIERSPLTDEQAEAVVCFDNRMQVIA